MPPLKYLAGYPESVKVRVQRLIEQDRLAAMLHEKYPGVHKVRSDRALYDYAMALKNRFLRNAEPLSKVVFDRKLQVVAQALGTHTTVSRVQGTKLKAKREIRIDSLFKDTAPEFLRMIVVHELAHLRQREHDRSFYALCVHMEPDYHEFELDLRLHLTQLELAAPPRRDGLGA